MTTLYNLIILFLMMLLLVGAVLIVYRSYRNGISPMPSNFIMHLAVIKEVGRGNRRLTIVDAGSGFGHLLFKLAKQYPEHNYIGIENSYIPILCAKLIKHLPSNKNLPVSFTYTNMYSYNYSNTDLIVCYLFREGTQKLYQVLKEKRLSIKIVSIAFAIDDLTPINILTCHDMYRTKVYVYQL